VNDPDERYFELTDLKLEEFIRRKYADIIIQRKLLTKNTKTQYNDYKKYMKTK